jgi:hypothetical protein
VQTVTQESQDVLEFHVFMEGPSPVRGIDYGLTIEGGEFVAYTVAMDRGWVTLPIPNAFPGSIGQVLSGPDCPGGPIRVGKVLVRPDEPGGVVTVDATRSAWSSNATLIDCDNRAIQGFVAFPARVNGRPDPPHVVWGKRGPPRAQEDPDTSRAEASPSSSPPEGS